MHKQSHTTTYKSRIWQMAARIDPAPYVTSYAGWDLELVLLETSLARDGALLVKGGNKSLPSFSQYSEKAWQLC